VRWDRLFTDLEGRAADLELEERDALVHELRDGEWAETSWRDLAGGHVVLDVAGLGRVEGEVKLVNEQVVHLESEHSEHVVASSAVLEILSAERRSASPTAVTARLGWAHVLRAVRYDGDRVFVTRPDGRVVDGSVDAVGHDFVRLATGAGRIRTVPFAAIAAVTLNAS
jgi:hypothetical protein